MWKLSLAMGIAAAAVMAQDEAPDKRLQSAENVLQSINSEKGIPHDLFTKARCAMIVPGLKKGAFVFGADYGRGFAICRSGDSWGAPAAIRLGGGSFGAQLGVESTDVVILVMNQRGMDRLASDKFTIGADASAAIGPVGRTLAAGTDATLRAEMLTYSRSKGAFAGVALDGTTVTADRGEDKKLYGSDVKNGQIIRGQIQAPAAASSLIARLNALSGQGVPSTQAAQTEVAQATPPPVSVQPTGAPAVTGQPPASSTLPQTASPYPAIGLMGGVFIALFAAMRRASARARAGSSN